MLWGHTRPQPARARADRRARHLRGAGDGRASTPCSRTPTCRARRPTGSSSPTSRCSRSTASATSASRSRSSPPSTPSRRGARPRRCGSSTSRSSRSTDMERATEQPPIHDENPTAGHGFRDDPRPNVLRSIVIRHGDPEAAGEVCVERRLRARASRTRPSSGPSPGLAVPDGEGGVDVYVATQWLHVDRDQVAPCLGLEPEQVRIHLAGVGGAFGGREDLSMQVHGAMLALHTDRPVKIVYSREESFVGHVHRHPAKIWMEHRATRDGKLVNVRARILLDGGAYASSSSRRSARTRPPSPCGPYKVENALIESTCVYSNNPPCGAMRGFGAVQGCFAHEAQMDKLAAALEIDPVELRLLNALGPGDTLPTGPAGDRLAAGRRGDPARRRAAGAGARGAAARPDPPPGRRGQHDPRPGRPARGRLRGRLQERLLLGGLRRLVRGARAALGRRGRAARRRGALRRGRGRPGRDERDPAGRPHRARHRRRRARARLDRRRRLGRLGVGVAPDLDGRGRRAARLPGRAGGVPRDRQARSTSSAPTTTRAPSRSTPRPAR